MGTSKHSRSYDVFHFLHLFDEVMFWGMDFQPGEFGEGNFLAEEPTRFKNSTSEVREDFSAPTSQNDSPRAKAGVETGRVDPWITVPGLSCL